MHFKKQEGHFAGSSFEQNSMQRLRGVPSPISGGKGWVGSGWAGIFKGWGLDPDSKLKSSSLDFKITRLDS